MTDAVNLELDVACIVGILPRERVEPQPVRIRLRMELDLGEVGDTGDLDRGVDYGAVDGQIRFLAVACRFRLIESFALAILRTVLLPPAPGEHRARVTRAAVRIAKPTVLRAAIPSIELARDADWAAATPEALSGGGWQEPILTAPEVTVRRLHLPGGTGFSYGEAYGLAGAEGPVEVPFRADHPVVLLAVRRLP
ncbi:MAG: dihydroneopterin aldolase [Myxococcota bacterium]